MPSKKMRLLLVVLSTLAAASRPPGQTLPQLLPFVRTGDVYVSDSSGDTIWRFQDLDLDGTFNGANELVVFYDDVAGPLPINTNNGIAVGPDGTVYVVDSNTDQVVSLRDANQDGDAVDAGEALVFFDGATNQSGILMASGQDLTVDAAGVVFVATADTSGGGVDAVLRLEDLGGTPGANDPGEALYYYQVPTSGSVADSIPTDVAVGPNGFLYYVENGPSGLIPKGIYRLHDDVVPNGHCNDPGEASPWYIPAPQAANAFHWGIAIDRTGVTYLTDSGNEILWKVVDLDLSLSIAPGTAEETLFWTAGGSSTAWRPAVADDGSVFLAEDQSPDRLLRLADNVVVNGNALDPGEALTVFDESVAGVAVGNVRSLALARRPVLVAPAAVATGQNLQVDVTSASGDFLAVWISTGSGSVAVPPFGVLELSVVPPDVFGPFYEALVPASGTHTAVFGVPTAPALVGLGWTIQGLAGPLTRLQFSNGRQVTIQ